MFEQCTLQDVFTAKTGSVQHGNSDWIITFQVHGEQLNLEIDRGARCNVLSRNTAGKFCSLTNIEKSHVIITGVSGRPEKAYEQIDLPCTYIQRSRA
jgi:hypothetical protein